MSGRGRTAGVQRKSFIILTISLVAALTLFLGTALTQNAWADPEDEVTFEVGPTMPAPSPDSAGNTFMSGNDSTLSGGFNRDLYWAGNKLSMENAEVAGDAVLAGRTIDISGLYTNGSLRAACQDISVSDAVIGGNITAAAQTLTFNKGCRTSGVYVAGSEITFNGECDALAAGGNTVVIGGTINGDAKVNADNIIVTDDAVITGTLTLNTSSEPTIASGASVADLDVHITADDETTAAAQSRSTGSYVIGFIYWAIAFIIICMLIAWLAPRTPRDSIDMLAHRTGPFILTGIIALIVTPVAFILLLLFIVSMPVAFILLALGAIVGILGVPFMIMAIASRIFGNTSPVIVGLISAVVAALLLQVPVLKTILIACGIAYLSAYLLQKVYLNLHARAEAKHAAAMAAQRAWGQAPAPVGVPAQQTWQQPVAQQPVAQPIAQQPMAPQPAGQQPIAPEAVTEPIQQPAASAAAESAASEIAAPSVPESIPSEVPAPGPEAPKSPEE